DGGAAGFGARTILVDGGGSACAAFPTADASASCAAGLAARAFFRNGFVCLATVSHSARSSSLSARLRRGGSTSSGMKRERFIGRRVRHDDDDAAAHDPA